jgi:hypothetical protein
VASEKEKHVYQRTIVTSEKLKVLHCSVYNETETLPCVLWTTLVSPRAAIFALVMKNNYV